MKNILLAGLCLLCFGCGEPAAIPEPRYTKGQVVYTVIGNVAVQVLDVYRCDTKGCYYVVRVGPDSDSRMMNEFELKP